MRHSLRILLPWLEPQDAIGALLGFRMPDKHEDIEAQKALYEAQRAHLGERAPFEPCPAIVGPLPGEIAARGEALIGALNSMGATRSPTGYRSGIVDLTRLLSIQKGVGVEAIEGGVDAAPVDQWSALAELCLALPEMQAAEVKISFDKDGKGMTAVSANPNVRVSSVQIVPNPVPGGTQVMGFSINSGTRHVHVVEYKGRFFLKDGYHRSFRLLSRGITHVPCIWETAESFQAIHTGVPGTMTADHLLGDHPPRVVDFLDPKLSALTSQVSLRKIVRIRAEEIMIGM